MDGTLGHTIYRKTTHKDLHLTCRLRASSGTKKDSSLLSSMAHKQFVITIVYRMKFNTYSKTFKTMDTSVMTSSMLYMPEASPAQLLKNLLKLPYFCLSISHPTK
jgi:hypothetical protein